MTLQTSLRDMTSQWMQKMGHIEAYPLFLSIQVYERDLVK